MTITHKSGNNLDMPMQVTKDGAPVDLTDLIVVYRIDTPTPIEFSEGAGLIILSAVLGLIKLRAARATMTLVPNRYVGALRITDPADPDFELELPDGSDPDDPVFVDTWVIGAELVAAA